MQFLELKSGCVRGCAFKSFGWMHAALRARHLARFRICVQIERRLPKWTQIFANDVNFSRCSERTQLS